MLLHALNTKYLNTWTPQPLHGLSSLAQRLAVQLLYMPEQETDIRDRLDSTVGALLG